MGGFMVPVVYKGNVLGIEYDMGSDETLELDSLPRAARTAASELVGMTDRGRHVSINGEPRLRALRNYVSNPHQPIMRSTIIEGWIGYASAPGYLDRTDPQIFDTEQEALDHANEAASGGEDEDEDDNPSTLGGKVR